MSTRQVRVLLTGGIGAGKSSVGELLRSRGALVIDADRVGHEVLGPDGEAFVHVLETWPSVVVDGVIDRGRLADIVFRSAADLERLEGFTHTSIRSEIARRIEKATEHVVVVEVPLMTDFMGTGWIRVVVDADAAARANRLRLRGMDQGDADRRMAAQPPRDAWVASAHMVIDNSADPQTLKAQVDALWDRLTAWRGSGGAE